VLRLRWNVAAFLAASRDLRIGPEFLGDDVPANTNRCAAYCFILVRCRLLRSVLCLAVSKLTLNLSPREPQLLLTKLSIDLELLPAIDAFLFDLSLARSALEPP
jgi:hypothetical protein